MAERRTYELDLCRRVGGEIKCKSNAFDVTYEEETVGPVRLEMEKIE